MIKLIKKILLIILLSPNLFASHTFPVEGHEEGFEIFYSNQTLPGEYTVIWESSTPNILSLSRLYVENGSSSSYVLLKRNLIPKQDALIHAAFEKEKISVIFPSIEMSLKIKFNIERNEDGLVSLIPQENHNNASQNS